jgi:hypothetical protein
MATGGALFSRKGRAMLHLLGVLALSAGIVELVKHMAGK